MISTSISVVVTVKENSSHFEDVKDWKRVLILENNFEDVGKSVNLTDTISENKNNDI